MSWYVVDVESDGPIPGDYSMVSFAAVLVEPGLTQTFSSRLRPISDRWVPEALAVSGHTRDETLGFANPAAEMTRFRDWLASTSRGQPRFVSDNNGYDWMFVQWYFHHFLAASPFGYSSTNLGSLYKGLVKDMGQNFKHLRKTVHTHDPLDDVLGNAEALLALRDDLGLQIEW